jgi:hypothetical protein
VSEERSAFARWSQRKLAARRGEAPPDEADEAAGKTAGSDESQVSAHSQPLPQAEASRQEQVAGKAPVPTQDAPALPSIDELDANSDYTAFLGKDVPEALARAALRKLWTSDPVLANLDGLNNYDEDYNLVDQAITAAQTSYRPGLGYLDEIKDKLAQAEDASTDATSGKRTEPQAHGEIAHTQSPNRELGDSDARKDNGPDAPRPVAAAAPHVVRDEPSQDFDT